MSEPDEMDDYSGPFRPDFQLEDLSKEALVTLCREFMMVAHLLDRAIMPAIVQRFGARVLRLSLAHPSLQDVFLARTGKRFVVTEPDPAPKKGRRRKS